MIIIISRNPTTGEIERHCWQDCPTEEEVRLNWPCVRQVMQGREVLFRMWMIMDSELAGGGVVDLDEDGAFRLGL